MENWEYMIEKFSTSIYSLEEQQKAISRSGERGWELVSVISLIDADMQGNMIVYYFKRPIEDTE
jgi:hypothetical protein